MWYPWLVADGPIFDLGPLAEPGAGGADRARDLQQVRRRAGSQRDRRSGLMLAVAAIAVALAAMVLLPRLLRDDSVTGETADQEPVAAPAFASEGAGGADLSGADQAAGGFEPPSAEHLRADQVAVLFDESLDRADTHYGIAYVANDDFVVLDQRGISVPDLEIAVDFATVSGLALLTNDGRTWAIDPDDRDRSFLVSNSYVVVVSERPGTIAVIRPDDLSQIGLMSSALPVPPVTLPEGADLLWVQGRGPLVMPRTGGTFEVSGLASSLERISDDRAVAASTHGTIYESCADDLSCTYSAQQDGAPPVELPFEPGTVFTPSPDGAWVVVETGAEVIVYDVGSSASVATFDADTTAIDWAPDGSFVAIIADDLLQVVQPDSANVVSLKLNHTPDTNSLLVFSS